MKPKDGTNRNVDTNTDSPRESCGLFGVFGVPDAASLIHAGLFSLQHRGQEGAGIVVSDGIHVKSHKGLGEVTDVFSIDTLKPLKGDCGIGHVRYSTTGGNLLQNVQPLVVECCDGIWAIAHNGNLVNAQKLRHMYQEAGAIFQTSTDSEVLVHLLSDPLFRKGGHRVAQALAELKGSFSFLLMTKDYVMAARDPLGFKPLSIGTLGNGYVFSSETCAFNQIGAKHLRDVEPGELVFADTTGLRSTRFADALPSPLSQCVFEHVYFARPDSILFGQSVHNVRVELGRRLAQEHPVEADIVIAIPDSGNSAALGYSQQSGIPLDFGFIRNHYVGRTFIMPDSAERAKSVDMKLSVVADVVRGKHIIVVDDSIIRGNTCQRRVQVLRKAGAKEIHLRISCPPTTHPCHFGIDFATRKELVAAEHTLDEVRAITGADSLGYLSLNGLLSPFAKPADYCTACFTGKYPVDVSGVHSKLANDNVAYLSLSR